MSITRFTSSPVRMIFFWSVYRVVLSVRATPWTVIEPRFTSPNALPHLDLYAAVVTYILDDLCLFRTRDAAVKYCLTILSCRRNMLQEFRKRYSAKTAFKFNHCWHISSIKQIQQTVKVFAFGMVRMEGFQPPMPRPRRGVLADYTTSCY